MNKQHPKIIQKNEEVCEIDDKMAIRNKQTTEVYLTNLLLSPGNLKNFTLTFKDGSERSGDQM